MGCLTVVVEIVCLVSECLLVNNDLAQDKKHAFR